MGHTHGRPVSVQSVEELAALLAEHGRAAASRGDALTRALQQLEDGDEDELPIRICHELALNTETALLVGAVNAELSGRMLAMQADLLTAMHRVARSINALNKDES